MFQYYTIMNLKSKIVPFTAGHIRQSIFLYGYVRTACSLPSGTGQGSLCRQCDKGGGRFHANLTCGM